MTTTVDLIADLGESFGAYRMGDDDALLNVVSSARVARGFHAGDPRVMDRTVGERSSASRPIASSSTETVQMRSPSPAASGKPSSMPA